MKPPGSDIDIELEEHKDFFAVGERVKGNAIVKNEPETPRPVQEWERKPIFDVSIEIREPQIKVEDVDDDEEEARPEPKGVIHYELSNRAFIDKGWTMLPVEKVVRKMYVYRMRPAHPEFDWFSHNKNKGYLTYNTGERLADINSNGRGRWFYKNGLVALDYYDSEDTNAQQRFIIYSNGLPDDCIKTKSVSVLAMFDYIGNGVVFDHSGKIRLKYNQTEGVILDRKIGPPSHWKWHSLNDPPTLQRVMIDTQLNVKDPDIVKLGTSDERRGKHVDQQMDSIEIENFLKEKAKKMHQKFQPFQIRMKALKINDQFSLKILDQSRVYLIYREGGTTMKLNLGMILDHTEIIDTDTAELGEVTNVFDRPGKTDSIIDLRKKVQHTRYEDWLCSEHQRRVRTMLPVASADRLVAATSRPLRPHPLGSHPLPDCSCCGFAPKIATECKSF